jgi:prepilin-type N-terminal cleavage/methylation domain-containing protein
MTKNGRDERGFSLIELTIALTVTLLVAGAVYGLLTSGNSAFRREPSLADRQQNIRLAMDAISRDVYEAGRGIPRFAQVFTDGLDACSSCPDGGAPMGAGGAVTDELEIFSSQDCSHVNVCNVPPGGSGTGASITTYQDFSACYTFPTLVIIGGKNPTIPGDAPDMWGMYWAEQPGGGSGGGSSACPGSSGSGGRNGHLTIPPGQNPLYNPPGGIQDDWPNYIVAGQVIRYRIRDDAEGIPNLERSPFGGEPRPDGSSSWEILARGIEDLQIQYQTGAAVAAGTDWTDTPGTVACETGCAAPTQAEYDTIVSRVRITLSARALAPNLQGQTTSAVGDAPRGQLHTEVAPRAAAATLAMWTGEM